MEQEATCPRTRAHHPHFPHPSCKARARCALQNLIYKIAQVDYLSLKAMRSHSRSVVKRVQWSDVQRQINVFVQFRHLALHMKVFTRLTKKKAGIVIVGNVQPTRQ